MSRIVNLDTKHKTKDYGTYTRGVYICPHCHYNLIAAMDNTFNHMLGFAEVGNYHVAVIECPKCFERFCHHARQDTYNTFLRTVEHGRNIHHKSEKTDERTAPTV